MQRACQYVLALHLVLLQRCRIIHVTKIVREYPSMSSVVSAQRAFLLVLAFVGLGFCQPMHVFPLANFIEELLVALGVLLAGAVLLFGLQQLKLSLWMLMWIVLGGLLAISAWLHPAPFVAYKLFYGVFWFIGLLALLIGDQLDWQADGERLSGWLAKALLVIALLCAVGGFLRFYGLLGDVWRAYVPEPNTGRMTGLVGHSNFFAFISFIGLLAAGWLFNARRLPLLCLASVAILVTGLIASGGRAVLLAWVVVVVLLFIVQARSEVKRWLWFMVGAFAFYWLFKPVFFIFDQWFYGVVLKLGWVGGAGLGESDVMARGAVSTQRLDEWKVTIALIREHLWSGVGVGNYAVSSYQKHLEWGMPSPDGIFVHSHNSPLQLVVELGLAGFLWLLGLLGFAVAAFWRASADVGRLLPLLILLTLQIYGLLEFPLWMMHFLALHMLLVSALGGPAIVVRLRLGKAFAVVLLMVCTMASLIYLPLVERFVWSYRQYFLRLEVTPQEYAFVDRVIRDPLLEPFGYLLFFANFELSSASIEREITVLERFKGYLPYPQVLIRLAVARMVMGDEVEAQRLLKDLRIFYGARYESLLLEQIVVNKKQFPGVMFEKLLTGSGNPPSPQGAMLLNPSASKSF